MKRIIEFDGLRAFAVLIVIADHYAPFRNFANGAPARLGGFGVDVFFVLSGYLITNILLDLKTEYRPYQVFYIRRFLRILPPFILLLLLVYGSGVLLHEPFSKFKFFGQLLFLRSFKDTGAVAARVWDVLSGATVFPHLFQKLNSVPILRDYPWLPMSGSLGPTWSLSVEEWFYVLWAPLVLMCRKRIIVMLAVVSCAVGFTLRWLGGGGSDFFSSVDILIVGAVLAIWMRQRSVLPKDIQRMVDRTLMWISGAAFLLFVVLTWLHRDLISRTLVEIFVVGMLSWIIVRAGQSHPVCVALRFKPIVYLGTISYSIYLFHLPMYFMVRSVLHKTTGGLSELSQMWIIAICSIAATIAFSALSWKYYERPILGFKDFLTERIKAKGKSDSHADIQAVPACDGQRAVA